MKQLFSQDRSEFESFVFRIIAWQIGFTLLVALLLWVVWIETVTGWVAGMTFNLVYFITLAWEARGRDKETAFQQVASVAGSRMFLVILFLFIVLKTEWVHFGATVCGVLSLTVIYFLEMLGRVIKNKWL